MTSHAPTKGPRIASQRHTENSVIARLLSRGQELLSCLFVWRDQPRSPGPVLDRVDALTIVSQRQGGEMTPGRSVGPGSWRQSHRARVVQLRQTRAADTRWVELPHRVSLNGLNHYGASYTRWP